MREIALFVEDRAHREVIGALVQRLAAERDLEVRLHWHSAAGGHGRVAQEFRSFLTDLERAAGGDPETRRPDLIVVATDANCHGFAERAKEILPVRSPAETVLAVPDPHIERWLLLDGAAEKTVLGRGCDAPDQKCIRHRYKQMLSQVVLAAGLQPHFDGVEFAADIVREMDPEPGRRERPLARTVPRCLGRPLQDLALTRSTAAPGLPGSMTETGVDAGERHRAPTRRGGLSVTIGRPAAAVVSVSSRLLPRRPAGSRRRDDEKADRA